MTKLIVTRGLPASGKSTYAHAWVAEDRAHRARINRDDLRDMVHNGAWVGGVTEPQIVVARDAAILALLAKGVDIINDDTNLPQRVARDLARLAWRAGADFEVKDFTGVDLDECLRRDAARTDKPPIGEAVIRSMHARFLAGKTLPLPLPEEEKSGEDGELYVPQLGSIKAVLIDVDGTVALMGARSPFDESRVHEDEPNLPVLTVVRALHSAGYALVFVSGRSDACYQETGNWLAKHLDRPFKLYMRAAGDMRKDAIVKREIFDKHIRHAYNVLCVLDDRDQVVEAWRAMGLTVLQVAEGNF